MNNIIIRSFMNPLATIRLLKLNINTAGSYFNIWVSFFIYTIGYLSVAGVVLQKKLFYIHLSGVLFSLLCVLLLGFIHVWLYTFFVSQQSKVFVSYKEILLIHTVTNIPILIFFPIIYIFHIWLGKLVSILLFVCVNYYSLFLKKEVIHKLYGCSQLLLLYFVNILVWLSILVLFIFLISHVGFIFIIH